jgi:precorrin-6B methylase 2
VQELAGLGLSVITSTSAAHGDQPKHRSIDFVFGVHVAHFHIAPEVLSWALMKLNRRGVLVMNFIAGNTTTPFRLLEQASRLGMRTAIGKPTSSATNEWYAICARTQHRLDLLLKSLFQT